MMSISHDIYSSAGRLLCYPTKNYVSTIEHAVNSLSPFLSELAKKKSLGHLQRIKAMSLGQLEELYTTTFDINGRCCLDVGYLIFGEDYKRGEFLVYLNQVHRKYNNDLGVELGDHLCNMLNLLKHCDDQNLREELTSKIMLPALEKMLGSFAGNFDHLFYFPLMTINEVLKIEMNTERVSV